MQVAVIGAGIIGVALAYRLQRQGAQVTLLDAGTGPGGAASAATFGWLNASFYQSADHFALRSAGLAAWRALQAELDLPGIAWPGALWWEDQGPALDQMQSDLQALGYDVARLKAQALRARIPQLVGPPAEALQFTAEGVVDPAIALPALVRAFTEAGGHTQFGTKVMALTNTGALTDHGPVRADKVVICAGTGAEALLASADIALPMLPRPGALLRSNPVPRMIDHVLVTPQGEFWQDAAGRIITTGAIAHQSDTRTQIDASAAEMAQAASGRLEQVLTLDREVMWPETVIAYRPVPEDGLPVIGAVNDRHYVAVMHSGMTLAAITAELAAQEVLDAPSNQTARLAPFRPDRFQGARSIP